jgi:hypothetical protein
VLGAGATYVVVVAGGEVRSKTQPVRLRKIKGSNKNFMWYILFEQPREREVYKLFT